jgi:hypothetical protein
LVLNPEGIGVPPAASEAERWLARSTNKPATTLGKPHGHPSLTQFIIRKRSMIPKTQEITITRTILASPPQVYEAFTRSEGWCEWFCEKAETDPRVGGKLHIYTEGYNAYGEFTL